MSLNMIRGIILKLASQTHQLHNGSTTKISTKYYQMIYGITLPSQKNKKTCLVKFRTGLYMGHARKQLLVGREAYPSNTCPIYNSLDADAWLHVLFKCKQQHIHVLITKRHNKAVWEIRKIIISNKISRHYTFINAGTYNGLPHGTQRCHCNIRFKPDILCILGHPYNHPPP
jgi:hypothetical protein